MRLAFCLFKYFPYGGLQRDFLKIATACQQRGHEINIYTMAWVGEKPAGFKINLIPKKGWTNYRQASNFSKQLLKILSIQKFDAVIGFNKIANLDIYFAADPCFAKRKFSWLDLINPRYRTYCQLEQTVFEPSAKTQILLLTEQQRSDFIGRYNTPLTRLHLLSPGLDNIYHYPDNAEIIRQQTRAELNIPSSQIVLLTVCSYFKTKGLDRSLYALAALPESLRKQITLLIIGGDKPAQFKKLAEQLKIADHVRFLGAKSPVLPFYFAADLLIHPAYKEAAGLVLIEAMACGLPVLTTDICGYSTHITNANAGLVINSPFDQKQLNQYLINILTSDQRQQWSKSGLYYVQKNNFFAQVQQVTDFIERLDKC